MQIQPVPFLINQTRAEDLGVPPDEAKRLALLGTIAAPNPVFGLVLTQFLAQREIDRIQEEAAPSDSTGGTVTPAVPTMDDVHTAVAAAVGPVQEAVAQVRASTQSRLTDLDKRLAVVEKKVAGLKP